MGKIHNIATAVALTGLTLAAGGQEAFSQSTGNSNGKASVGQVQKGTQDKIAEIDTLSHKTIINMSLEKLLQRYGDEKGREVIKQHMLIELNATRKELGLGSLEIDTTLAVTAQEYAQYCAENNHFDHIDLEGKNPIDRVKRHGYEGGVTENLYKSSGLGIRTIIKRRMESAGHEKNIENGKRSCGIGLYKSMDGWIYTILILDE